MKKRNEISYETATALFGDDVPDDSSYFRVSVDGTTHEFPVPLEVVFRLFRIAQAYGIRQLRYLEPNSRVVVGSVEVDGLIADLQRILALVNDEVIHHYVKPVLEALQLPGKASLKHVAIKTGDYFKSER